MQKLRAVLLLVIFICCTKALKGDETRVRFDGAQLWRVTNLQNSSMINTLRSKYDGDIWKSDRNNADVLLRPENLESARKYLTQQNVTIDVVHGNVQKLIDDEKKTNVLISRSSLNTVWDSGMHWQKFHELDVIYEFLNEINQKYPNLTSLETIGKTLEGRELKVLRISDNPKKFKKMWVDGGIHAREWISPASVTYIINDFITNWHKQPSYIRERTWYFSPVINPDGYVYSWTTDRNWRKNRGKTSESDCVGVDLNRNFRTAWENLLYEPCSEAYGGLAPESELEIQAITKFLLRHKSDMILFLSYHSYGQVIYYPWAYKKKLVKNVKDLSRIGKETAKRIKNKSGTIFTYGAVSSLSNDNFFGTSLDWSYSELGVKNSFVMELPDTGDYGFILPARKIIPAAEEALIFVKTIAEAIYKQEL